ncbi:MAG: MC/SLC25 family protein [Chlamydiia bacterium]|nr:MC/SLC25 family protein [Chlamydiia bacterium]
MKSSFLGIARGVFVDTLIYPFDVIKIRQQNLPGSGSCIKIAMEIFRQEGFKAFYAGLTPQLYKNGLRHTWWWPVMTQMPKELKPHIQSPFLGQALTGFFIGTLDAMLSAPFERGKVLSAAAGESKFSLSTALESGWQGVSVSWAKRSVSMMTFLCTQEHLREAYRRDKKPLNPATLTYIGTQVAFIVSIVSAPFDFANTKRLSQEVKPADLLSVKSFSQFFRGWPIHLLSLVVHNVASVVLLEKLN